MLGALLAVVVLPQNGKALTVMLQLRDALKGVRMVSCTMEGRYQVDGKFLPFTAEMKAARDPVRYRVKLQALDPIGLEYAALEGTKLHYSEAGKNMARDLPETRIVMNWASSAGLSGYDILLDHDRWSVATSENCFFVHEEEIEGNMCDLIGLVRTVTEPEKRTAIRYIWVDKKSHLPRAFQVHSLARGQSMLSQKTFFKDIVLNPVIDPEEFRMIPEPSPGSKSASAKQGAAPLSALSAGSPCPDVDVQTTEFKTVKLRSLIRGKTLVSFWAPWCGPCLAEIQALKQIDEVKKGTVKVIALGVSDSKENMGKFAAREKLPFQVLFDPECQERDSALKRVFGIVAIPHAFLFGPDGKLIRAWVGFEDQKALEAHIRGK